MFITKKCLKEHMAVHEVAVKGQIDNVLKHSSAALNEAREALAGQKVHAQLVNEEMNRAQAYRTEMLHAFDDQNSALARIADALEALVQKKPKKKSGKK